MGNAGQERAQDGLEGADGYPGNPGERTEALRGSEIDDAEMEIHGALRIETRGPWSDEERPGLAVVSAVTDWGPWAQHNFPCPVCKARTAVVDIDGWIFSPCASCFEEGWKLTPPRRKRWWERLTRRRR